MLQCIRCGACLNACPVFRKVGGGHAYGAVYSGPLGAALIPMLKGVENYPDLPRASSLCGACTEVCATAIPLTKYILSHRKKLVEERARWRGIAKPQMRSGSGIATDPMNH